MFENMWALCFFGAAEEGYITLDVHAMHVK